MRIGIVALTLFVVFVAVGSVEVQAQLRHEIAFPNLTFNQPTGIQHADDGNDWLYVVEQPGRLRVFENTADVSNAPVFLDIQARVQSSGWEQGLLGLAFHPNYEENGYFYVNYTASGPNRTVISRFERSATDPMAADPASEVIFLEFNQPFGNHNGGDLTFGPDGYLYIAVGDGGSGGDPQDHGQNTSTLLGTILRIDVDANQDYAAPDCGDASMPYTIPDNEIADGPGGACDEIFAWGLRNPWRFSFDPETDTFWVADVGQTTREEINHVENGDNMGWRVMEGTTCYSSSNYGPPCNDPSLKLPVWEYGFSGGQSITGGFVYRGELAPEIAGQYVYADYMTGHIWALLYGMSPEPTNTLLFETKLSISSFGVDMHQHLYFTHLTGGRIYTFKSSSIANEHESQHEEPTLTLAGPNPFTSSTTLRLNLPTSADVSVTVFDVLGRQVAELHEGQAAAGETLIPLPANGLASGIHLVHLLVDGRRMETVRVTAL